MTTKRTKGHLWERFVGGAPADTDYFWCSRCGALCVSPSGDPEGFLTPGLRQSRDSRGHLNEREPTSCAPVQDLASLLALARTVLDKAIKQSGAGRCSCSHAPCVHDEIGEYLKDIDLGVLVSEFTKK